MSDDLLTCNDRAGEYPPSYYAATTNDTLDCPSLDGDAECDVCIIGAGYTGLSAAVHLAGKTRDVLVLEAHRVGWGASGRNGGQLGSGQRLGQAALENMLGAARARLFWDFAEDAKGTVRELIARHRIRCDLRPGVLHAETSARGLAAAEAEARHLRDAYGYEKLEVVGPDALGSRAYRGGVIDWGAGHLHPLNFALGLARAAQLGGARICEGTRVLEVERGWPMAVRTGTGTVRAKTVIFAGNGYLSGLEPGAARRVMPINNFIVATEPLGAARAEALIPRDVAVADSKFVVNYFRRTPDHRLLFGGGESYGYRFPADIARLVRPNMLKVYPDLADAKIEYAWGGTLAITRSRMPYFGRAGRDGLVAGGYSGHGVAMAVLAGKLMARHVLGAESGFDAFAALEHKAFPGGERARHPLLVLAMSWYALRDRLGI